ncbi:LacI family DNA-binding transcriptional regulator [uncultured Deinococcus sp.]|uniref:LacI family DNA-binding transcriptional regulator n=1 Tax=uncultured Deinococcus sp. TaxID=158789 RepID=UPI00258E0EC5|nr:LacI family DNA-binding transcriptional regulator [uncultured Deinococcus sp.]
MSSRPTMHDVARLAGVSIKTVSRVVNQEPRVDPDTRSRVQEAIDELGFRRNEQARSLRPGQSTALIGLVTGDLSNPFYSSIARGIEEVAHEHGHLLLTASSEEQPGRERQVIGAFLQHNVAGLVVVPTPQAHLQLTPEALRGIPVVAVDRPIGPAGTFDSVVLNNRAGAHAAVTHLLRDGHTRVAMIDGDPAVYTGRERTAGYLEALAEAGLASDPALILQGYHGDRQAEAAMHLLLDMATRPTAVFVTNNRIALGALKALHARRRSLALASFDDFELAGILPTPMTLVSYDAVEMGRQAARRLFGRIERRGGAPADIIIPVKLHLPEETN